MARTTGSTDEPMPCKTWDTMNQGMLCAQADSKLPSMRHVEHTSMIGFRPTRSDRDAVAAPTRPLTKMFTCTVPDIKLCELLKSSSITGKLGTY